LLKFQTKQEDFEEEGGEAFIKRRLKRILEWTGTGKKRLTTSGYSGTVSQALVLVEEGAR
jgi:hypothetical protein